jgi:transcription elongation factor SPT6
VRPPGPACGVPAVELTLFCVVEDEDEDEGEDAGEGEGEGEGEDGAEGTDDRPRKKKRRLHRSRRRSASAELDEDDLDLLDENLGRQSGRRSPMSSKFKRIRRGARTPSPSRRRGVDDIFSDEEDQDDEVETGPPRGEFEGFIEDDDEADSEDNDLIAEARRLHQRQQQRTTYLPNEAGIDQDALEEITQLFGDGLDYDFAMESSEEDEQEEQEQGEERLPKEVQLKDVFEPSELTERLLTDADELIRITDEPERFQLYRLQQIPPLEIDIEKESTWIAQRLLARPYKRPVEAKLRVAFRQSIISVLNFFNTESLEVPFIWQQRRDFLYYPDREVDEETGDVVLKAVRVLVDQDDLWKVWEEDGKYRAIQQRLTHLKAIWEGLDKSDRVVEETLPNIDSIEDLQGIEALLNFCSYGRSP